MKTRFILTTLLLALLTTLNAAELKPAALFSDQMVLQRDKAVPIWGWADPGEQITVEFGGQKKTTTAGADGKWMVKLDPLRTSAEPRELRIAAANHQSPVTVHDVLVGEVWLGSGQSNMAMSVNRAKDFEQEQAAAKLPLIRMFKESSGAVATPQEKCNGTWQVCSPETIGTFSATLYFFGRELHRELKVPVGLINSSVGGTPIESWVAGEAQAQSPELKVFHAEEAKADASLDKAKKKANYEKALALWKERFAKAKKAGQSPPRKPRDPQEARSRKGGAGGLFNGKIAPLIPYALRGAVWYQGEANSRPGKGALYQYQLPLLVSDWRARWGEEFPFAWVQLPNFKREGEDWLLVREAMLKTLRLPHTGMAITVDIGDPDNIHPKNKQEVGRRLSLWALGEVYDKKVASTSGPLPAGHKINGSEVAITFQHADGGLVVNSGGAMVTPREEWPSVWPEGGFGTIRGFAVAGADKQWHRAAAKIVGNTVVVTSPEVKQPAAVRYAWETNPDCNLYNRAGLPASPFRTDDWPVPAESAKTK